MHDGEQIQVSSIVICLIICRARMNILFIIKLQKIRASNSLSGHVDFPQSCWLLSLEWLACFEHAIQHLINMSFFVVRLRVTPNHILLKYRVPIINLDSFTLQRWMWLWLLSWLWLTTTINHDCISFTLVASSTFSPGVGLKALYRWHMSMNNPPHGWLIMRSRGFNGVKGGHGWWLACFMSFLRK